MEHQSNTTEQCTTDDDDAIVPQLQEHRITERELHTAIRVLNAVASLNSNKRRAEDGLDEYKQANLRPFRKAIAGCLELHKRTMFSGKEEEEFYEQRKQERSLKRMKIAEAQLHKKYIADTALRKGRVERLKELQQDAEEEEREKMAKMIPDGHITAPALLRNGDAAAVTKELPKLRSCYVCKVRFRELHHFYDQLCPSCAAVNWEKRYQSANLHGYIAVVTGSRVKIGFQTCLKLLRAGATVVATTRFPNSAVAAYRREADFEEFADRLQIYGLDLRDVPGIEAFTRFLKMKYQRGIDILINNACQTVRRPVAYYRPIIEKEQSLWQEADDTHKKLLNECLDFERIRRKLVLDQNNSNLRLEGRPHSQRMISNGEFHHDNGVTKEYSIMKASQHTSTEAPFETSGLTHSAAMSQMAILPEDVGVNDDILPPGISDVNGQQLDLRTRNSWLLKLEEVSTPEVMECMLINAIAPFVLNSRLKVLMTTPNDETRPDRFIINVSAMEGKFYRYKMPNHPHTNMAKASLNMLTRTSAEDLAKAHRIYMNSVDTGWINDENPLEKASKTAEVNNFQTPIDEIDAAARILDPIFTGVNGGREIEKDFGKFLKDFRESEW